jgi:hypothetical protein
MCLFARHTDDGSRWEIPSLKIGGPRFVAAPNVPYIVVILVYGPYEDQREIGRVGSGCVACGLRKLMTFGCQLLGSGRAHRPMMAAGSCIQSFGRLDPMRKMRMADPRGLDFPSDVVKRLWYL